MRIETSCPCIMHGHMYGEDDAAVACRCRAGSPCKRPGGGLYEAVRARIYDKIDWLHEAAEKFKDPSPRKRAGVKC